MRYSIIIPIYDPEGKNEHLTNACINSILKNSMDFEYELIPIYHTTLNYCTAVNLGLKRATGDYLIVVSNDIEINDNRWLEKYSSVDGVCSFNQYPFFLTGEIVPDASCWGITRESFNVLGLLDERFKDGYGCEDIDYWFRCKENHVPMNLIRMDIVHKENKTYKTYFSKLKEDMTERNLRLFREKWLV